MRGIFAALVTVAALFLALAFAGFAWQVGEQMARGVL